MADKLNMHTFLLFSQCIRQLLVVVMILNRALSLLYCHVIFKFCFNSGYVVYLYPVVLHSSIIYCTRNDAIQKNQFIGVEQKFVKYQTHLLQWYYDRNHNLLIWHCLLKLSMI